MGKRILVAFAIVTLGACARPSVPPLSLPFPTDTVTTRLVADGVIQRHIRSPKGPWAIEVLDVDLTRGYCAVSVKGAPGAAGRKKTSALLGELAATRDVVGGVNADFFALAGFQGVPTGALISRSTVLVGPGLQPVVAVDDKGAIRLGPLRGASSIRIGDMVQVIPNWNRPAGDSLAVYDANWGARLDTATGVVEVILDGSPTTVSRIDTAVAGAEIPARGFVLVAGRNTQGAQRSLLLSLKRGDRVDVHLAIAPFHPVEAVGGRPMLARDSVIVAEVETEGQVSFRARNPRTAVGLANKGRRLILAVIDGRQAGYSDGTTLRETAEIMLALGARDAINLDGGGSSALVYRDAATKTLRVANKPSDATGERAVGDALAIVKGCR